MLHFLHNANSPDVCLKDFDGPLTVPHQSDHHPILMDNTSREFMAHGFNAVKGRVADPCILISVCSNGTEKKFEKLHAWQF
jgi:hypothetical protein